MGSTPALTRDRRHHHVCPYAATLSDDDEDSHSATTTAIVPSSLAGDQRQRHHQELHERERAASCALSLARSKCPAYAQNTCPFRDAKNPEELRNVMKTVPPSHFPSSLSTLRAVHETRDVPDAIRSETPFQLAMEHVHRVSSWLGSRKEGAECGPSTVAAMAAASLSEDSSASAKTPSSSDENFIVPGGCPFKSFHRMHTSSASNLSRSMTLARSMEDYSLAAVMKRMADVSFDFGDNLDDEDGSIGGRLDTEKRKDNEDVLASDRNEKRSEIRNSIESLRANSDKESSKVVEREQQEEKKNTTPALTLSRALKAGTVKSHEAAENVHFVKNFVRGEIDRELYAKLVTGLWFCYVALERLLEVHAPQHFPSIHFPEELNRTAALAEDMEFWHGAFWRTKPECRNPSPAVRDYVARMEEAVKIDPLLLLAHAYTRYLGDLSGGKVLSRIARRALSLEGYDGLQFYHFEKIQSAKVFKDKYRAALDDLSSTSTELSSDRVGRLVAEANVAFALNMRVFEELDVAGGVEGSYVRDVGEALAYYERAAEDQSRVDVDDVPVAEGGHVEAKKCPFAFVGGSNPHTSSKGVSSVAQGNITAVGDEKEIKRGTVGFSLPISAEAVIEKPSPSASPISGRCPWPFVFLHDPAVGMRDWQTWIVIGLGFCCVWARLHETIPRAYEQLLCC